MPAGNYQVLQELIAAEQNGAISFSASGDNIVVAAVAGKQIGVLQYNFGPVGGATTLTWKSSIAGALSGPKVLLANQGMVVPYSPKPWIRTAVGEALVLNSTNAVSVGGEFVYILI